MSFYRTPTRSNYTCDSLICNRDIYVSKADFKAYKKHYCSNKCRKDSAATVCTSGKIMTFVCSVKAGEATFENTVELKAIMQRMSKLFEEASGHFFSKI